ncbi:MAG: hypothetical protein CL579_05565 [Alteromonadaceae bacterium]|nr:hypothetical protein [Alteromonadaceae bacterium]
MKKEFLFLVLLSCSAFTQASLEGELESLKNLCAKKLMPDDECKIRRSEIWAKYMKTSDENELRWFCNYGGENMPDAIKQFKFKNEKQFSERTSASRAVREIIDASGLSPNFVVRANSVPNAAAMVRGSQRYIEYNPNFIRQLKQAGGTNWAVYSVLAHEVGHHLQGHTLDGQGSRPNIELEADEYSGFILARMGATKEEAFVAMEKFGSDIRSSTHPAKSERLTAISKGYERANEKPSSASRRARDSQMSACDIEGIKEKVESNMTRSNIAKTCPEVTGLYGCSTRKIARLLDGGLSTYKVKRECKDRASSIDDVLDRTKILENSFTNICQTPTFRCQTLNVTPVGASCFCINAYGIRVFGTMIKSH